MHRRVKWVKRSPHRPSVNPRHGSKSNLEVLQIEDLLLLAENNIYIYIVSPKEGCPYFW